MTVFEKFFYKHLRSLRRTTQIAAILFIFLVPLLNYLGFKQIIGTFYSISVGNLDIVDPALLLQNVLLAKSIYFKLLLAGLIPLVISLFFGKIFCGWVCPFNLIAEYAEKLRQKLSKKNQPKINKNPKPHFYWFVYGGIFMAIAISGLPLVVFISMPGLISAQAADLILFGSIGIELLLIPALLIIEVFFAPRFWCKYVCPVGATLGFLRWRNSLTVNYVAKQCGMQCSPDLKAPLCNAVCPLHLNPRKDGVYPYCLNCGNCVDACQNSGGQALSFTFHPKEKNTLTLSSKPKDFIAQNRRNIHGAK